MNARQKLDKLEELQRILELEMETGEWRKEDGMNRFIRRAIDGLKLLIDLYRDPNVRDNRLMFMEVMHIEEKFKRIRNFLHSEAMKRVTIVPYCVEKMKRLEVLDGLFIAIGVDPRNYVRFREMLLQKADEYLEIVNELRGIRADYPEETNVIPEFDSFLVDADRPPAIVRNLIWAARFIYPEEEFK